MRILTWIQRYRLRHFLGTSVWVPPLVSLVAGFVVHRVLWWLEARTHWALLDFSPEGARAAVGIIASSMLTFMVLTFSILLLTVQIAGAQLSPRIITLAMRNRVLKLALGVFVFTFTLSIAVISRIEQQVLQLSMAAVVITCFASIGVFVYLLDYVARFLRPTSIISMIAVVAHRIIEGIYPRPLAESEVTPTEQASPAAHEASRTVYYQGTSAVLQAVDGPGLAELARQNGLTIQVAPQVGDFVTKGEPLFQIIGGGGLYNRALHNSVAFGLERTFEQDPAFALRIIVDIALKALSPAINDPSTAVLALDQIHRLLRVIGKRDLGDGKILDREGVVRVIMPTPNWEDFVSLGMSEIRLSGADSFQVVRRLRAMIENLLAVMPERRHAALQEQLALLERTVERSFADPADRAYAGTSDYQGMGSSRGDHSAGGPAQGG